MRVAILYNQVGAGAGPDESDVLVQLDAVATALAGLGHEVEPLACGLDLASTAARLEALAPDLVFNLVESLSGHDRLIHLAPALLDSLGLAYSGSPTEAVFLTTNKLLAKERLAAAGLPTPPLVAVFPQHEGGSLAGFRGRAILKSVWDHGSRGLADDAVMEVRDPAEVADRLAELAPRLGRPCFAEAFVEGRELNLSVLASVDGPQVLPPAEIRFEGYPPGKPRIVDYRAKWEPTSFEWSHTQRSFAFGPEDAPLLETVTALARRAWTVFGLGGWARVDFRVAADGTPWILEVNANPCLAPDAGFAAALEQAGISFPEAMARILEDALARRAAGRAATSPISSRPPAH